MQLKLKFLLAVGHRVKYALWTRSALSYSSLFQSLVIADGYDKVEMEDSVGNGELPVFGA